MKCKPDETIKVTTEIKATAYSCLCNGVDPDLVARIYYKMSLVEFFQELIGKSVPVKEGEIT